ncbi:single-stranded DNA-binding protein [Actinoallomurus iriomotensis]|uniref:Single-stranded DNA-binding protein n=1 Tax=Actinoallomurus iriomotensis TaxID=478107 RepID=A0A9W6VRB5_9ACTN|nr:single-stranded DNA-binding protein [Actinoallomurus iriomotensis]GLY82058.1 single-stranded DNA-binding protein [Actinoallomurus iriomotensis]
MTSFGEMGLTTTGRLTSDPELRFTTNGTPVASFTVACNPRRWDRESNGYRDGDPSFVPVQVWRDAAEHVAESLRQGDRVIVMGRWAQEHWTDDQGEKRSAWRLTASAVGPDLTFDTWKIHKSARDDVPPDDAWATASPVRPTPADSGAADSGTETAPADSAPAASSKPKTAAKPRTRKTAKSA